MLPTSHPDPLLLVLIGPTASGKSHLALELARRLSGEIVSCDSVAVFRGMDIGSSKPSPADRALIPHHLLDVVFPGQPFTAGDYSRLARSAIRDIAARGRLPLVVGGTGLYLRALLDGLAPAPAIDPSLRARLRLRAQHDLPHHSGSVRLHRLLTRFDPAAAHRIHPNDAPKLLRALEVTLTSRRPFTETLNQGRDPLTGFRVLQLGLAPARTALYQRIDHRAAAMFARGLLPETAALLARFGPACRPLTALGYAQAAAVLRGELTQPAAIALAQQGHRNYAKRQGTWFRRSPGLHWLPGFGDDPAILAAALTHITPYLDRHPTATTPAP